MSSVSSTSTPASEDDQEVHKDQLQGDSNMSSLLTRTEKWNIFFMVLSFACVISCMTLIVGTGAIVVQSVGGSTTLAPFALAMFFMGMSLVSVTLTHWIFTRWGRRKGFWIGSAIGGIGVCVAWTGLFLSSPALVLVSQFFLGAGNGIGMYLRFAATEVVPTGYHSRAVTWVLCGGCLAAVLGPESAVATKGMFGDENLTYLGTFLVAGYFYTAQAIFVGLIRFTPSEKKEATKPVPSTITYRSETSERSKRTPKVILREAQPGVGIELILNGWLQRQQHAFSPSTRQKDRDKQNGSNDGNDFVRNSNRYNRKGTEQSFFQNSVPSSDVSQTSMSIVLEWKDNGTKASSVVKWPNDDTYIQDGKVDSELREHQNTGNEADEVEGNQGAPTDANRNDDSNLKRVFSVLGTKEFLIPLSIGILAWSIMAMPMSIVRVTMKELGFSERQSLTVIECHFVAMFMPGIWTGDFIKRRGPLRACQVAIVLYSVGIVMNFVAPDNKTTATWYLCFIFLGFGWNFAFSAATVMVTRSCEASAYLKAKVQAANDFHMFLVSGAAIFSTGYLYVNAGDGGTSGWRTLNYFLASLVGLFILVVIVAMMKIIPQVEDPDRGKATGGSSQGADRLDSGSNHQVSGIYSYGSVGFSV